MKRQLLRDLGMLLLLGVVMALAMAPATSSQVSDGTQNKKRATLSVTFPE
jgi:hypothetical protein